MCISWKVIAGLAAAGLAVWVLAPNLIGVALPLLLIAACPLSMLLMGRGMARGQCATRSTPASGPSAIQTTVVELTRDEQIAELKAQLKILEIRQQALAREIAALAPAGEAVVREAEAVAEAADAQIRHQI